MQYTLYADRIFFLHFTMNYLLLVLTAKLGDCQTNRKRLAGAAAGSALFFLAVLLIPGRGISGTGAIRTAAVICGSLGALQAAFGFRKWSGLFRALLWYVSSACVLGGVLGAVYGVKVLASPGALPKNGGLAGVIVPSVCAAAMGMWMIGRERRIKNAPLWTAELKAGDTKLTVSALMESETSTTLCVSISKEVAKSLTSTT